MDILVSIIVIVPFKVIPLCLNSGSAAAVQGVMDDVLKLAKVRTWCLGLGYRVPQKDFMRRLYRASRMMYSNWLRWMERYRASLFDLRLSGR